MFLKSKGLIKGIFKPAHGRHPLPFGGHMPRWAVDDMGLPQNYGRHIRRHLI